MEIEATPEWVTPWTGRVVDWSDPDSTQRIFLNEWVRGWSTEKFTSAMESHGYMIVRESQDSRGEWQGDDGELLIGFNFDLRCKRFSQEFRYSFGADVADLSGIMPEAMGTSGQSPSTARMEWIFSLRRLTSYIIYEATRCLCLHHLEPQTSVDMHLLADWLTSSDSVLYPVYQSSPPRVRVALDAIESELFILGQMASQTVPHGHWVIRDTTKYRHINGRPALPAIVYPGKLEVRLGVLLRMWALFLDHPDDEDHAIGQVRKVLDEVEVEPLWVGQIRYLWPAHETLLQYLDAHLEEYGHRYQKKYPIRWTHQRYQEISWNDTVDSLIAHQESLPLSGR